ncbi:ABC transporter substrate-binding protein [Halococcus salifodinae]|uniref:Ferrichrome-binding protein n=1 Tax=Halococcus salifodinae DSM 8989 TaxID=1227456 RepID=M0N5J1_9EURY|nr:ABC transporter substrate-binding protein [Halococcus salifodinae]EMA53187.1 ferrichrome-binding protein [Halococcus salifodinae DSM 8989]
MTDDSAAHEEPTRREYVKYGSAIVGGALLAGCTGEGSSGGANDSNGSNDSAGGNTTAGGGESSYSVAMAPRGEVAFESVPETWVANNGSWADMGIALGQEPPKGLWRPNRYHTHVYDEIPGVSVDKSTIDKLWGKSLNKELFYELDADVHVFDPVFVLSRSKWKQADLDEVDENIGPVFGNSIYSQAFQWHDHQYYTLYEAFEKLAHVFGQEQRYRKFERLHDEFIGRVQQRLPPESERPSVAILLITSDQPEEFYPYPVNEGTSYKQWRDLGARSALTEAGIEDFYVSGSTIDYEALAEADPDVLLMWDGSGRFERQSREEFQNGLVSFMQGHDVASQLTAVNNDDVYRGAGIYQGPIVNLAWTERGAWQLYPDEFDRDEQLFDRQRVADIINGDG